MRDRLYIDKRHREWYDKLDQEDVLRHASGRRTRLEQFLFAVALGYGSECRQSLSSREGFILLKDVYSNRDIMVLLSAVAIASSNSVDVVADEDQRWAIVEEYASGGIRLLMDMLEKRSLGSLEKELQKELVSVYHKVGIGRYENTAY